VRVNWGIGAAGSWMLVPIQEEIAWVRLPNPRALRKGLERKKEEGAGSKDKKNHSWIKEGGWQISCGGRRGEGR